MPLKLIALSGPVAGSAFELTERSVTLGRDEDNTIVVDAPYVSRRHCRFEQENGEMRIVDEDSHNGTAVNGVPVTSRVLDNGDHVTIGATTFLVTDPDAPENEPVALELLDGALPDGTTLRLEARNAVLLAPTSLLPSKLPPGQSDKALSVILELVATASSSSDEKLPDRLLSPFLGLVPAERSAVLLGREPETLEVLTIRPMPFPVSRTVLASVMEDKSALLTNDVPGNPAAGASLLASKARSVLCLPLLVDEHVIGAIYLDSSDPKAPFPEDQLELLMGCASVAAAGLERARTLGRLRAENERLRDDVDLVHDMVGESPKLRDAQHILSRAAPTDTTVLIQGESGTGKELAARALHRNSPRRDAPLVKVDCTGLTENLLASELFGHEKGAFTGALQQKKGKLEIADGGTVFLDELGELPLALQSQLLRVLQDREFERVGGNRPITVDIRLVAATNRDLKREVASGNFREDLYYRLNVVTLELPPLRDRPGDVELLARFFVAEFAKRVKRPVSGLSESALTVLKRHDWPGNVRELANTIERAVVLGATERILPEDLPELLVESGVEGGPEPKTFHQAVAAKKKELILAAVARADGSITEAGKLLALHPNYLHRLISKLGLRDTLKGK